MDKIRALGQHVINKVNPGGISLLSNNDVWNGLIKKYEHITDLNERWAKINGDWWNQVNAPWIDEVIKRGDDIRLLSDPNDLKNLYNKDGSLTHFGREIEHFKKNGYTIEGEMAVKKD